MADEQSTYIKIIQAIFNRKFQEGDTEVTFSRSDLRETALQLGLSVPKNLGDIIYSIRYRHQLPSDITEQAPLGMTWAIYPAGRGTYMFRAVPFDRIEPQSGLTKIKVPDATPGPIQLYTLTDEQALLAKLRYNRLLDIFTGMACYSLQNHLRTSINIEDREGKVIDSAQVETDEIYIGIDKYGSHHILPIQAKGGGDNLSVIQIWQDFQMAKQKFPNLIANPIAAQFLIDGSVALFEFSDSHEQISITSERHYSLVPPENLTDQDLREYREISSRYVEMPI